MAAEDDKSPVVPAEPPPAADPPPVVEAVVAEPVVAAEPVKTEEPAKELLVHERPSMLEGVEAPGTEKPKEEAKPAEVKPADEKPVEPKLDKDGKPIVEAKPAEPAKAAEEAKPAETAVVEPPKLEAVTYEYAVPETISFDDAGKADFHTALDSFRQDPAKGVQGLLDLHAKSLQTSIETLQKQQHRDFNATRDGWNKDIMADPEFGGAGHKTAAQAVARMRDMFVTQAKPGTPEHTEHWKQFNDMMRVTGAGDHPAFWRILHNMARFSDEPAPPPPDAKPSPTNGANPRGRRGGTLYDNTKF